MYIGKCGMNTRIIFSFIFMFTFSFPEMSKSQMPGVYPPFTKWYQDPLGLKPLELSTAFGFVWGSSAIAACFIFTKKDSAFQKRFSVYQEAGFGFGYKSPYTSVFQNDIGLIYGVREWMSLGLVWNIFHFKDKTNNTWSFGIRPFVRWYPYKSKKTNLFFEYGAGLSYSLTRFPLTGTGWDADTARTGTRFNLTSMYGIGCEFRFSKRFSFQSGVRHFHLSNGNLAGIQRNPSHDDNGFFIGFIYQ
jgi:Lipid A 3-O-deacylase (PagL)